MSEYPYRVTEIVNKKRYPTYQFHGRTINDSIPVGDVMSICILETMSWLRGRLSNQELPAQLDLPEPEKYAELDKSLLRSFTLNLGFTVDVVYSERDKLWAFCLIETDNGANIGTPKERPAVPGRSFETNIAFRADSSAVEVGVQTICSEPENTTVGCEVFRPSVVKALYRNKNVGLRHILNVKESPFELASAKEFQRVKNAAESDKRELPIIFITTPETKKTKAEISNAKPDFSGGLMSGLSGITPLARDNFAGNMPIKGMEKLSGKSVFEQPEKKRKNAPVEKVKLAPQVSEKIPETADAALIAKLAASFAFVCTVPEKMFPEVKKAFCERLERGDILILYKENAHEIIPFSEISKDIEKAQTELCDNIRLYPKRRRIGWGNIVFSTDAKIMELRARRQEKISHSEETALLKAEIDELNLNLKSANELVRDQKASVDEIRALTRKINDLETEAKYLKKDAEDRQAAYELQKRISDGMTPALEFYKEKSRQAAKFPTDREKLGEWAETFADTLYLHKNALNSLKKYARPLDMQLLCDGLYFLHGYALYRQGKINGETLALYAEEYSWEVQPSGKEAIKLHREDYTVSMEKDGKSAAFELDKHIKYGVNPKRWVRIYFFFDEQTKRVVVGSMPDHLPTVGDKT